MKECTWGTIQKPRLVLLLRPLHGRCHYQDLSFLVYINSSASSLWSFHADCTLPSHVPTPDQSISPQRLSNLSNRISFLISLTCFKNTLGDNLGHNIRPVPREAQGRLGSDPVNLSTLCSHYSSSLRLQASCMEFPNSPCSHPWLVHVLLPLPGIRTPSPGWTLLANMDSPMAEAGTMSVH